jgi:archaeosine-15-forming tRNA-guanine transglycosylase
MEKIALWEVLQISFNIRYYYGDQIIENLMDGTSSVFVGKEKRPRHRWEDNI